MGCGPSRPIRSNKVEPIVSDPPQTRDSNKGDNDVTDNENVTSNNNDNNTTVVEPIINDRPKKFAFASPKVEAVLRNQNEDEVDPLEGKLVIDLKAPAEEAIVILQAELSKLQPYGANRTATEGKQYEDTSKAQASLITKLEADVQKAKAETMAIKQKYDKQVKRMRVSSAKIKAEADIQTLNLKAKVSDLERNFEICKADLEKATAEKQPRPRSSRPRSRMLDSDNDDGSDDDSDADGMGDNIHAALIVSLSEQIASQDEELTALRLELEDARKPQAHPDSPT